MSPAALQIRKPLRSPAAMGTPRSVRKASAPPPRGGGTPAAHLSAFTSFAQATAMRVPSSEQLSQLSVPRLRKQVSSRLEPIFRTHTASQRHDRPYLPLAARLGLRPRALRHARAQRRHPQVWRRRRRCWFHK